MSGAVSGVPKTEGLKLKVQNPKSLASAKLPTDLYESMMKRDVKAVGK